MGALVVGPFAREVSALAMVASLLWFGACAETPVSASRPGLPVSARLELTAVNPDGHCGSPYPLAQLRATLVAGDGNVYATPIGSAEGPTTSGFGTLDPAALSWNVTFGQLTRDFTYLPPVDLLPVIGSDLTVTIWVTQQPSLHAQLVVHPRFDCPQYVNLTGRAGVPGSPSGQGGFGETGPTVRVAVGYLTGPQGKQLVLVRVEDAAGIRARTVSAPEGPPLQIFLDGGSGGSGGPSRDIGAGAITLAQGTPGPGGDGGDGGGADVAYDDAAPELEHKVSISNRGGAGGFSLGGVGRPGRAGAIPRVAPVPARTLFRDELAHGIPIRVPPAVAPAP